MIPIPAFAPVAVPPLPTAGNDKCRRPVRKPRRGDTLQRRKDCKRPCPAVVHARPKFARLIVEDPNERRHDFSFSAGVM